MINRIHICLTKFNTFARTEFCKPKVHDEFMKLEKFLRRKSLKILKLNLAIMFCVGMFDFPIFYFLCWWYSFDLYYTSIGSNMLFDIQMTLIHKL